MLPFPKFYYQFFMNETLTQPMTCPFTQTTIDFCQQQPNDPSQPAQSNKTLIDFNDRQPIDKRNIRRIKTQLKKFQILKCYFKDPAGIYDFLEKIALKFNFSKPTVTLGIYFYNQLFRLRPSQHELLEERSLFYSSVCLMIAAKAVQFDMYVPYFSRYQKYADWDYDVQDYEELEYDLLREFNFDVQVPTFETLLYEYLVKGVQIEDDARERVPIIKALNKADQISLRYVKRGEFLQYNQQILALKITSQIVQQFKLLCHPVVDQALSSFRQLQSFYGSGNLDKIQDLSISPKSLKQLSQSQFSARIESKIDFSEKLASRISKENDHLKVTSPMPFLPLRSLENSVK